MAGQDQTIRIRFDVDTSGLRNGLNEARNGARNAGNAVESSTKSGIGGLKALGIAAAAAGAAMLAAGAVAKKAFSFGSELVQEAAGLQALEAQFSQTFGSMEAEATAALSAIGKEMNIDPSRLMSSFARTTAMFKGFGIETEKAMAVAEQATRNAADGAAFYDVSVEHAAERIDSFIKGNTQAAESVGIFANAAELNKFATEKLGKSYDSLSESEKMLLRSDYVDAMYERAGVTGQAVREADGLENVLGNLKSAWSGLKAVMGAPLLELVIPVLKLFTLAMMTASEKIKAFFAPMLEAEGSIMSFKDKLMGLYSALETGGFAGLAEAFSGMFDGMDAGSLIQKGMEMIQGLKEGMLSALPGIAETLFSNIGSIVENILGFQAQLLMVGAQLIAGLVEGVVAALPGLVALIGNIGVMFVETMAQVIPDLIGALAGLIPALGEALVGIAGVLAEIAPQLVESIVSLIPTLMETVLMLVETIISTLLTLIPMLIPVAIEMIMGLVQGIIAAIPMLLEGAVMLVQGLVDAIVMALPLLLAGVIQLIQALVDGIVMNLPLLLTAAMEIVLALIEGIVAILPMLIDAAIQIVLTLVEGILALLPTLIPVAIDIIMTIYEALAGALPLILTAGIQLMVGLLTGLISMIPQILVAIVQLLVALVVAIVGAVPRFLTAAVQLVVGMISGIVSMIGAIIGAIVGLLGSLISAIAGYVGQFLSAAVDLITGMISGIGSMISSATSKMFELLTGILNKIKGFSLLSAGKDLVMGLIKGIGSMAGKAIEAITGVVDGVVNKAKSLLGIKSPSRLFRNEIGKMIPAGLGIGIQMEENKALDAVKGLAVGVASVPFGLPEVNGAIALSSPDPKAQDNGVDGGNTFIINATIREEADIIKLSKEIVRQQQRRDRAGGSK